LDENKFVAAILMDLSKAFDCLPHDLILLKLKAYGMSEHSTDLLKSYLSHRKQCVRMGNLNSQFLHLYKGVPQGSILGPVLFNIFINDIFYFISNSSLYNYADDNTLSYSGQNLTDVVTTLEEDSKTLIAWFSNNKMQANPDKFQGIAIGKKSREHITSFNLGNNHTIKCDEEVKLLGVTIDFQLKFNSHISNICKKSLKAIKCFEKNWKTPL